jgi:hypothetical protein
MPIIIIKKWGLKLGTQISAHGLLLSLCAASDSKSTPPFETPGGAPNGDNDDNGKNDAPFRAIFLLTQMTTTDTYTSTKRQTPISMPSQDQ